MNKVDQRILQFIEELKAMKTIRFDTHFCEVIGLHKQGLIQIKRGDASFRLNHIEAMMKEYNVNANWLFGRSENMFLDLSEGVSNYEPKYNRV